MLDWCIIVFTGLTLTVGKTLLVGHVSLGVFNNSRENNQCRLIENQEQVNVGGILSGIARGVANRSGLIA